jgi:hypothetical protein
MSEEKLDFVHAFLDSRGKWRREFRRKGFPRVTLKGKPHSPEFQEQYQALLTQSAPKKSRAKDGTVDAELLAYLRDVAFTEALAKDTQVSWRRILERFADHLTPIGRRRYGDNAIASLGEKQVKGFYRRQDAQRAADGIKGHTGLCAVCDVARRTGYRSDEVHSGGEARQE